METDYTQPLSRGRMHSLRAAQWLALIGFQAHGGAPIFGPGISTYNEMFDPTTSEEVLLRACYRMRQAVRRQAVVECLEGEKRWAQRRPQDPYNLEWRTTQRGAILETIVEILDDALDAFRAAGLVAPD